MAEYGGGRMFSASDMLCYNHRNTTTAYSHCHSACACTMTKPPKQRVLVSLLTFHIWCICCNSNKTCALTVNLPNSVQLGSNPYHSRKVHLGSRSSVGMRRGIDRHTHTHTCIHCFKKCLPFSYQCSFYKCWPIFGTLSNELMCNISVIYLLTSPTYCCYTTLGNIGCSSKGLTGQSHTWMHKNWCPIFVRIHKPHFCQ